ncbi:uncharacterized protein LOC131034411 isoform X5 [Cryptomeria japonica]|uniref:uncharacterized protein LOC131034411 isoform X5 n=1 Tax=Cryptomeria japonica TaxID=3369 RepID=UPI0027DA8A02|nr:uncharacterized protein LOC131034411 isoform X5 [Cryptomeria japonica]
MKSKAVMISPKKLSSGEYSQAMRSTEETTELGTNESSQANKLTGGDHAQKFLAKDVFLSHSGAQKNFVRQLHRDLTNQGVSCFFDEDPESLPLGEDFPPCIFEAAETCRVAVLLLSKEFLETKWPMQELCTFVKARDKTRTNPNLKILPLFFMIPPKALKQFKADNEKWKEFEKSEEKRAEWEQALNAIRRINGLKFSEGSDEVEFRDKIVKEIWRKLPTHSLRYHVPCMQGEERMCQEVADFFNSVQPNEKGIRIAGLYGIAGHGKTTLGKAFCNLNLGVRSAFYRVRRACTPPRAMSLTGNSPKVWQFCFEGKICHLEFSRGDSLERIKLALQYLTYCPQSHLQTLTSQEQAQVELYKRVKGQTVLLVLDNITEESVDEVRYYVEADFRKNSCILLSARSVDVLVKHCKIDSKSCMRVPSLEKDEALGILLEGTSLQESSLGAEDKAFALKCANRCSFKEISNDIVRRDRTFHPLALKAFGGHLFSKYGSNLAKWVTEIDGLVDQSGYGLDDVFAVLGKAFDDIRPKYRTIFMLLTVYMLPNMSPDKVTLWLAIICNEEISFVEKAVEDLCKKAFIEEFEPEIRIHDLYIEFAQSKAKEMGRWLWWKGDGRSTRGLISQENGGFELAKLEQCVYRSPTQIAPKYLKNLLVLQLIGVQNMRKLDLGRMDSLRSITLHDCQVLAALDGMENLLDLAWLQIRGVNPLLKLPEVSSLLGLQYLEIDIAVSQVLNQLGDLTPCFNLREINVRCPSLLDFPKLNGLPHLEKVEFNVCDKVKGPLDCTDCVELQSIVLNSCCQMAASPLLAGCKKPSKIVLWECDAVTACPDIYLPSALKILELFISSKAASVPKSLEYCYGLENLQLWNMGELKELPSFRFLSNLTVLKLGKCGIREPPDLTCCVMLEDVYFFTLKNLERFPNFSSLRKLKKLSLYNCRRVQDPPDISGCHQLQVLHIVYNDKMEGLPNMGQCSRLEEIKLSWPSENEVTYEGIDPDSCEVDDDDESWLEHFKDENFPSLSDVSAPEVLKEWPWLKDKTTLVKRYFRGVRLYYSITVPYESYERRQYWGQATPEAITLQIVDGMVVPLPTHRMVAGPWTETVRKYFAGKKDIVRASAPSGGVKFRDEIIRAIFRLLPAPSQRYHVSAMQGEARMCQEIADFFKHVQPNEKGIRIAGLYGMEGMGKTTLCKAFCNLKLEDFDGKVYHIEFCRGNSLDRENPALTNLQSELQELASEYQGQRVLLVLDNIETEESTDDVRYCLQADLGENSCILLSARSVDVLIKNFNIDSESCMSIPGLEEEEAISILLERTSPAESAMAAENRGFALQCANICSFKETSRGIIGGAHTFHPLALKTFGRYLFSKYRSDLSKWVAEIDGLVVGSSDGLDDVFTVLDRVFDDMNPKYCTIFMLLTVYMLPKMSLHKVTEWLAINCNEEIEYIEKAVEDLWQKAFIEEIKPEIRIHDLFMEFGQSKARKMGRWLWCKDDLITSESKLFSKDEAGFELAKLEHCRQRDLSQIGDKYVENLWALQVVDGEMNHLRFSSMKNIRSLILHNCEFLEVLQGMENLPGLAWLQIRQVPMLKFVKLNSLTALQHLEIDIGYSGGPTELGDLAGCVSLREIYVRCPFLLKFPRINGLPYLEKAKFQELSVIGPLDCAACVKLQSIDFEYCWQMVHIPLIDGCSNLSKIVLNMCDQVTECSDKEESSALEIKELCISSEDPWAPRHSFCCDGLNNLPLWNIVIMDVPSLRRLSNLTVLKLYDCDISEPPDVTCCSMLEDVCFFTLQYLKSFPNFSSLRKLKNLCLCNCGSVRAPPDIGGCHELRVFHLLYNDNMKGLPMMDGCPLLDEIKLSWLSSEEILYYSDSYEDDDLEFCLDYQKDEIFPNLNDVFMPVELKEWQWMQGKRVRVKQYFRREKVYYSIAATCESYDRNGTRDSLEQVIIHRASTISDEDEVRFIDKVTRAISRLIPPKIRFPYSSMQEEEATLIWPAKAVRFKPLSPTVTGIHIAGLYQTEDNQKTILRESFFKFILKGFEGGVSSLEFSAGNSMERLDNALKYLTHSPGLKMRLPTSEFLDQDAFSKGPTFNIMMLLIRYPIPDKFMDDNLMDIARDFHINWAGNTRIVFHSQRYTIIEFSRH